MQAKLLGCELAVLVQINQAVARDSPLTYAPCVKGFRAFSTRLCERYVYALQALLVWTRGSAWLYCLWGFLSILGPTQVPRMKPYSEVSRVCVFWIAGLRWVNSSWQNQPHSVMQHLITDKQELVSPPNAASQNRGSTLQSAAFTHFNDLTPLRCPSQNQRLQRGMEKKIRSPANGADLNSTEQLQDQLRHAIWARLTQTNSNTG